MEIPEFVFNERNEFRKYSKLQVYNIIIEYLFNDATSFRKLDSKHLKLVSNKNRGFESFNIVGFFGLTRQHKGLLLKLDFHQFLDYLNHSKSNKRLLSLIDSENINQETSNYIIDYDCDEENETYCEGRVVYYLGKRYERNPIIKEKCLAIYGFKCKVCGFDFGEKYGRIGHNYIEIHHINPISSTKNIKINPRKDVLPVCSNCHRMFHRRKNEIITPNELRKMMRDIKYGK